MKKVLSAVLTAALLVSTVPAAFAASDIDGHWAKSYITELHENGIINPSASTGNYGPDDKVTRWEFMRYINRAFGFTEKADISFSDVNSSDVFYETVQIAVKQGYINGVGNNRMAPEGTLTREQAATILGRLHKYTPTADLSALDMFSDRAKLSDYSKSYVAEAVKQGYINGYTNGTFKPQGTLSRGEIAKMLYGYMGTSLNKNGNVYSQATLKSDTKNVTISVPCTLADADIKGNLYITEGVLAGNVTLEDVTVAGDIIVSGGNTFYIVIDYDKPVDEEGEQYETYFFSVVDEADLLAAAEAAGVEQAVCSCSEKCEAGAVNTDCAVCSVNMSKCVGVEPEPEPTETEEPAPEEAEPETGGNMGMLLAVLAVALVGGGAAFYFKVLRPKQQKAAAPQEDYGDELTDYDEPDGYGDEDDDGPPWDEEDDDGEEADK